MKRKITRTTHICFERKKSTNNKGKYEQESEEKEIFNPYLYI